MSKKYVVSGIVVLAVIIAGALWFSGRKNDKPAPNGAPAPVATTKVDITANGFQPAGIVVKVGDTVTWTNRDSAPHWVASAPHPAHSEYDGTAMSAHCAAGAAPSFDACKAIAAGGTYSFTFTKTGTWRYHDHLNPVAPFFGSVTVR